MAEVTCGRSDAQKAEKAQKAQKAEKAAIEEGGPEEASAAVRHERLLLRLLALTRVMVLGQAAAALAFHWNATRGQVVVIGLLGVLVLDNAGLLAFHMRRGALNSRCLATLDVCLGMAALVIVVALLKPTANPGTDNVMYPYTVATVSIIGMAYRRLLASILAAALTSAVYISATAWRFGGVPHATLFTNASTYWAWAVGGWFLADRFRMLSTGLDHARRVAARREAELAAERERSRHVRELNAIRLATTLRDLAAERERVRLCRSLHDRVLQTMEFMGRDGWITDPVIRDHVAAEAAWLRDLVRGDLDRCAAGMTALSAALDRAAERQTRAGLRIELNTSGLKAGTLPEETVEAITGAVTELLTNVRKHAGTTLAVVRAISAPGTVTVTVLDRGRGFDPVKATGGVGLRESVIARLREVDGHVVITSEPGTGTHVEIAVPILQLPGHVPLSRDMPLSPRPETIPT